jgi:hypothetical protein
MGDKVIDNEVDFQQYLKKVSKNEIDRTVFLSSIKDKIKTDKTPFENPFNCDYEDWWTYLIYIHEHQE